MYVFAGEFNEPMSADNELYRVFDQQFQDPYTLFRNDLTGCKEEDFFYTFSREKSSFHTNVTELDKYERRVSAVIHSNWQTRYLSTLKIPSFFNKFLFVSLQGKSHEAEVNTAEPVKSTGSSITSSVSNMTSSMFGMIG